MKDVDLILSPQESEQINNAIIVAMNLLEMNKNNQHIEIDVLEHHLKEMNSMLNMLLKIVEDMKFLRKATVMSALDSCVKNITNALNTKDVNLIISPQESEKINNAIFGAMNLLDKNKNNQQINIDVLEHHLKELTNMLKMLLKIVSLFCHIS